MLLWHYFTTKFLTPCSGNASSCLKITKWANSWHKHWGCSLCLGNFSSEKSKGSQMFVLGKEVDACVDYVQSFRVNTGSSGLLHWAETTCIWSAVLEQPSIVSVCSVPTQPRRAEWQHWYGVRARRDMLAANWSENVLKTACKLYAF